MKLGLSNSIKNRGGAVAFTPASLSGLQFWYKNGTGITESDGSACEDTDAVHGWADQSGNDRHATGVAPRLTYNAASGGVEGGGNNKLNITQINFTGQFSFWVRLKFDTLSGGANDIMFSDETDEGGYTFDADFLRIQTTSQIRSKIGGSTAMNYATTIATGTYYNIGFERDGSNDCRVYLGTTEQGSEISNANAFNLDRILGAIDGICLEVVVTNAVLSSGDRTSLNTYLNTL